MSTSTESNSSWPELRIGPIITGAALVGVGTLIALAGLAVGGTHLFAATRQWIQQMDVPPSEQARIKLAQAKSAAAAGNAAWHNGVSARQDAGA
ncbi:MAG TPA: hypothetical protein VF933_24700 [Streptosporangiaceae bacterium]